MRLVIDRDRWSRGGLNGPVRMLNASGCMCCLGFLARECGYEESEMADRGGPVAVRMLTGRDLFPPTLQVGEQGGPVDDLIITNDRIYDDDGHRMTERDRESEITRLMAQAGVEVEFVGGVTEP